MTVTPFAGVWIEIRGLGADQLPAQSLPSRECGLKSRTPRATGNAGHVTPFAGVWIEIPVLEVIVMGDCCHSLRGSVD